MPNRIIKESAFLSDKIASLSDFQFRLWVGLITQADDAGRGDARPAIIKGHIFALRERVTIKDVDDALHALAAYGCVSLYSVDGKPYYMFPGWTEHQRVRDVKPKYPAPENGDLLTDCGELPQIAADCRLNPNPNPNPNPNTRENARTHKEKYGEYAHVMLTKAEFDKLGEEYGSAMRDSCIDFLDKYIEENPTYKKASHYLTIKRWVVNAVNEHKGDKTTKSGTKTATSFDVDDAVAKAMRRTYEG